MQHQEDSDIIRQVMQGQTKAYALLVDRYQNFVFTLVLRYINNREEAEEVAQDIFVKAFRSLADFRGQSKFSTWLYTIVNTSCISQLRKKKEKLVFKEHEDLAYLSENNSSFNHTVHLAESRSEKKFIDSAIAGLPEMDCQVITLYYQHEQSMEEIGTILGLTVNNVKIRLFRARQKLKVILSRDYMDEMGNISRR
jgi:RNA polymerase sigma factor (sigma-70 family)